MKAIIFGDVQLHSYSDFAHVNEHGYNNRAYNLLDSITQIIESQDSLDAVIIAGDFFHNRASIDVDIIALAQRFVSRWASRSTVVFLAGNHDQFLLNGKITSIAMFKNFSNCVVIEEPQGLQIKDEWIHFSPFDEDLRRVVTGIQTLQQQKFSKYLIGHWTVQGSNTGHFELESGVSKDESVLSVYDQVILGDIHLHQRIGKNIMYVGSPCQHDFGEGGAEKFVWMLDSNSGLKPIKTSMPKFVRVLNIEDAKAQKKLGNYVELLSKDLETSKKALRCEGIKIQNQFNVSLATEDRPLISSITESIDLYCKSLNREDLVELGNMLMKDILNEREVPQHQLKIRGVSATNFFSYQSLEFDLSNNYGFVVINGVVSGGVNVNSNGAGKTTLFECVLYAVYGNTLRYKTNKEATITEGCKDNKVVLHFEVEADKDAVYVIERTSKKLTLSRNGESLTRGTAKDTQALICSYFGPIEFFLRISFLGMHYNPSFLSLGDTDKKLFIDRFCGLDIFDNAKKKTSDSLDSILTHIRQLTQQESLTLSQIESINGFISQLNESVATFEANEDRKSQERLDEIARIEAEIGSIYMDELPPVFTSDEYDELCKSLVELPQMLSNVRVEYSEERSPLNQKLSELRKIASGSFKKGYVCTSCGYTFTGEEDSVVRINHAQAEIEVVNANLIEVDGKYKTLIDDCTREINSLNMRRNEILIQVQAAEQARERVRQSNQNKQRDIEIKKGKIQFLKNVRREAPTKLIESLNTNQAQQTTLENKLTTIRTSITQQLELQGKYEFWVTGFGSKGCKSLMYTSIFDRINTHLQEACNQLSGGNFIARLSPVFEGKEKTQEKINLELTNIIGASNFGGDSIGERARIDIAVNLSLRKSLVEMSNYGVNLYFVDEPWLGLDESGKRAAYQVIKNESSSVGNLFVTDQDFSSKGSIEECTVWTARKSLLEGKYISMLDKSVN